VCEKLTEIDDPLMVEKAALVQSWRVLDNRDHGIGEG
jgi:hypothetical protein